MAAVTVAFERRGRRNTLAVKAGYVTKRIKQVLIWLQACPNPSQDYYYRRYLLLLLQDTHSVLMNVVIETTNHIIRSKRHEMTVNK
jgi:hypothetical protein